MITSLKRKITLGILICCSYTSSHSVFEKLFGFISSPAKPTPPKPTHIIVRVDNYNNLKNTASNAAEATSLARQNLLDSSRQLAQQHISSLRQLIMHNKLATTLAVAGTSYVTLQGTLFYLNHKLNRSHCWSKWHNTQTLAEIYTIPQSALAKQLLNDVQRTHTKLSNPLDFTTPLISFVKDLETEIKYLNLYKNLVQKIQSFKLGKITWIDSKLVEESTDRLYRLEYIKSAFFTWLVNHKIDSQKTA